MARKKDEGTGAALADKAAKAAPDTPEKKRGPGSQSKVTKVRYRRVIDAMYKLSTGYTVQVKRYSRRKEVTYDPETGKKLREVEEPVEIVEEQHVAPSVSAATYWMTNLRPPGWAGAEPSAEELLPRAAEILLGKADGAREGE